MSNPQTLVKEMEELITNGQYSEVENVWMEAASFATEDVRPFTLLADQLASAGQSEKAQELLELLVEPLVQGERAEAACAVVNQAARLNGSAKSLVGAAKTAYSSRLSDADGFEEVLREAEAKLSGAPNKFVERLESLCSYVVGDFLFHDAGWGLGEVVGLDLKGGSLLVSFDNPPQDDDGNKLDPHRVKLEAATNFFRKIPADHLMALKRRKLDELKAMVKEQPDELIRIAMRSLDGKVQLRRLKETLIGDVIPKTKWAPWWNATKAILVSKGQIRIGKGANPSLELLHIETSLEDEYNDKFAACHTPVEIVAMMRNYLKEESQLEDRSDFLTKQLQGLFDLISAREVISDGEKILGKFLLEDVKEEESGVELEYPLDVEAIANDDEKVLKALTQIKVAEFEIRLLEVIRDCRSDWPDIYCKAMLKDLPDVWDHIEAKLRAAAEDDKLYEVSRTIFDYAYKIPEDRNRSYAEQFIWLARRMIAVQSPKDFGFDYTRAETMRELMRLGMDIFHRVDSGERRSKALLQKFRAVLAERNCKLVSVVLEEVDEEGARHLLHSIQVNRALSESRNESLAQIVLDKYPDLAVVEEEVFDDDDDETGPIKTTPAGMRKKRKELNDLRNVEMPAIAKAIGEALAQGDISENAELDAARAKEGLLKAQLARISTDLERAQVVTMPEVDASVAGFGTKVTLLNTATKEEEKFTILGRWDSDSEKGVISDISAIGKGVRGLAVGEDRTFSLPDGSEVTYQVLALEAAVFDNE